MTERTLTDEELMMRCMVAAQRLREAPVRRVSGTDRRVMVPEELAMEIAELLEGGPQCEVEPSPAMQAWLDKMREAGFPDFPVSKTCDVLAPSPYDRAVAATDALTQTVREGKHVVNPNRGDGPCQRCGGPNVVWYAPSPLWNQVMRGGDINGDEPIGIVCPICFVNLCEDAGVAAGWRLEADAVYVELQTVTPSGRVWNPDTFMWDDPS